MQNSVVVFILSVLNQKYPFQVKLFGKCGQKNQNCQFEQKIGTRTNLNMNNSMTMFIFTVFDQKNHFFKKICSVSQNSLLELKFNGDFDFCFDWKQLFWVNLVQKSKTVSLRQKFGIVYNLLLNYLNLMIQKQLLTSALQKSCL